MVRTIAEAIIAAFIVIAVATGISGLIFKRVGEAIFNRALGRLWQRINERERSEEQQRKIQLISQQAMAKEMTMHKEQELEERSQRRARIRSAHDRLTASYAKLAAYASASPGSYTVDAVAEAKQAAAQLQVECPELAEPLIQIGRTLQSPQNIGAARAHQLLEQVTEGVEKALRPHM